MTIVVDSNIAVALFLILPYSKSAQDKYIAWVKHDENLIAPTLFEYEVASILRRNVNAGILTPPESLAQLDNILSTHIQIFSPTLSLHRSALTWAARIGQAKTYDAHYLALAAQENAEFWTADKRLVNGVRQLGVDWIHWIGEA